MEVISEGQLRKYYSVSDLNLAHPLTIPMGGARMRLLSVGVTFKTVTISGGAPAYAAASVTKTCTVTLDSEGGSAYDALLNTISLSSASAGQWAPEGVQIFSGNDALVFSAEAGGTNIVSTIMATFVADEIL